MNQAPDGFEQQRIDPTSVDAVIDLLSVFCGGPREAMALLVIVIKKLNSESFRDGPIPSNEELCNEVLVSMNSISRGMLQ